MKALWLTKSSLLWYALTLAALALVIAGLAALIRGTNPSSSRCLSCPGESMPPWKLPARSCWPESCGRISTSAAAA